MITERVGKTGECFMIYEIGKSVPMNPKSWYEMYRLFGVHLCVPICAKVVTSTVFGFSMHSYVC